MLFLQVLLYPELTIGSRERLTTKPLTFLDSQRQVTPGLEMDSYLVTAFSRDPLAQRRVHEFTLIPTSAS